MADTHQQSMGNSISNEQGEQLAGGPRYGALPTVTDGTSLRAHNLLLRTSLAEAAPARLQGGGGGGGATGTPSGQLTGGSLTAGQSPCGSGECGSPPEGLAPLPTLPGLLLQQMATSAAAQDGGGGSTHSTQHAPDMATLQAAIAAASGSRLARQNSGIVSGKSAPAPLSIELFHPLAGVIKPRGAHRRKRQPADTRRSGRGDAAAPLLPAPPPAPPQLPPRQRRTKGPDGSQSAAPQLGGTAALHAPATLATQAAGAQQAQTDVAAVQLRLSDTHRQSSPDIAAAASRERGEAVTQQPAPPQHEVNIVVASAPKVAPHSQASDGSAGAAGIAAEWQAFAGAGASDASAWQQLHMLQAAWLQAAGQQPSIGGQQHAAAPAAAAAVAVPDSSAGGKQSGSWQVEKPARPRGRYVAPSMHLPPTADSGAAASAPKQVRPWRR